MSEKPTNPKDMMGVMKAPMSTVSAPVMAEVGVAMLEGALKYGRHNYRAVGVRASVYYDATMRHLMDWWEGQDIDPDSGMSHITKAITSLVVLRDSMIQENWVDDRPPHSPEFYSELNQKVAALREKYSDRSQVHYTQTLMSAQFGQQNTLDYRDPRTVAGVDVAFETEKHMNFTPEQCECHRCIEEKGLKVGPLPLSSVKMILCPTCGNKRCPKANDHRNECSGSNEPGQPGSAYK
ncbi:dATP/dGTP diphosphohydrolase domain-containing protein [Pseudidiomarina sp.]|uniref:dATP/dGTP diphosphohydrolase domain-containing protein n=1 Tax=Pseudidiomarina sp. TaxID=2081707 RepID=UPI003A97B477